MYSISMFDVPRTFSEAGTQHKMIVRINLFGAFILFKLFMLFMLFYASEKATFMYKLLFSLDSYF